jgi:hypothetical protein
MQRANWMPPEEAVSMATARVASLIAGLAMTLLYLFQKSIGPNSLMLTAIGAAVLTLLALAATIYLSVMLSYRLKNGGRILGGFSLTEEAQKIRSKKKMTEQDLFTTGHDNKDLVWTRPSQALAQMAATFAFLALQVSGSIALSAVAILLAG